MYEIKKFPHDDDVMKYNYEYHRYELTENALLQELGINFNNIPSQSPLDANPSARAKRFIREVSGDLYNYLLSDVQNPGWLRFELACVPELRSVIKEFLLAQAQYEIDNGRLCGLSGIDAYKGKLFSQKDIADAEIELNIKTHAETIIEPSIGRTIKTACFFGSCPPPFAVPDPNDDTKVIAIY